MPAAHCLERGEVRQCRLPSTPEVRAPGAWLLEHPSRRLPLPAALTALLPEGTVHSRLVSGTKGRLASGPPPQVCLAAATKSLRG